MAENTQYIHGEPVIATTYGQPFSFLHPDPNTIHIDDIAESLAKESRYNGKTPGVFYSVAEHSVLVSYAVPDEYGIMALLHDMAEAYTKDRCSPYKKLMDSLGYAAIREIDDRITRAAFKKYGVKPYSPEDPIAPCVHEADQYVYVQERHQLMNPASNEWWDNHGDPDPDYPKIRCLEWREAKAVFIQRFNELFYGFGNRTARS